MRCRCAMKAQVLHTVQSIESRPLVSESVADPVLGPDDVLVRVKACGVCHSNLHMIEGDWGVPSKLPIIPGHEIAGVVEAVGSGVKAWRVGQRVGVQVLHDTCRQCEYCLTGRENLCLSRNMTGETLDGGYAELVKAPWDFIYAIPDGLGFEEAAPLFCPGVTAYRAVKRAGVRPGQKVGVIGIGGVGHMSLQFARLAGGEVVAVDRLEGQLELARELGADHVVPAGEFEEFVSKTGKLDVVMVHAPSQQAVDQAMKAVKRGGTVLMAVVGNIRVSFADEHTIIGSVIGSRMDMIETSKLAGKRKVQVKWQGFKLEEANDVLLRLKRGEIVGRAVLIP